MKIIRFEREHEITYGVLDGETVFSLEGAITGTFCRGKELCRRDEVRMLPPVLPRTIIGVGANYYRVLKEVNMEVPKEPSLFLKAASCVIGDHDPIQYPQISDDLRIESELAVIIKKEARFVPENMALDYVLGYTCANDLTLHDINDRFPTRNKSFYTSCPLGPCIATDIDGDRLPIKARVNNDLIADVSTGGMVFNISQIIAYISRFMPLEPFDVILTGTPHKGVKIEKGDRIEIEIDGIGILHNHVSG